jgi:hypothetical protein
MLKYFDAMAVRYCLGISAPHLSAFLSGHAGFARVTMDFQR